MRVDLLNVVNAVSHAIDVKNSVIIITENTTHLKNVSDLVSHIINPLNCHDGRNTRYSNFIDKNTFILVTTISEVATRKLRPYEKCHIIECGFFDWGIHSNAMRSMYVDEVQQYINRYKKENYVKK